MKKLIFFLLIVMFLPLATANLTACSDTNEIDTGDIPCNGITDNIDCLGFNISVTNVNTTAEFNVTTSPFTLNSYNFTINFTDGSYQLVDCQNNTATIIIGDFPRDDLWKLAIMIGFIGISFVLVLSGKFIFEEQSWIIKSFLYIAGALVVVIGIDTALILSRVTNITTLMTTTLLASATFIFVFISYMFAYTTVNLVKAVRESKREKKSEI